MNQIYTKVAPKGALQLSSTGLNNVEYNEVSLSGGAVSTTIPDNTMTIVMQTEELSLGVEALIEYDGGETLIDRWGSTAVGPNQARVFPVSSLTSSGGYPKLKLTGNAAQTVHLWFYK
jgi:hypothetical protein